MLLNLPQNDSSLFCAGDSVADSKTDGQEELPGEEPGGSGDARLHLHHLLRQDGDSYPEQNDRGPSVVRQSDLHGRHQ